MERIFLNKDDNDNNNEEDDNNETQDFKIQKSVWERIYVRRN